MQGQHAKMASLAGEDYVDGASDFAFLNVQHMQSLPVELVSLAEENDFNNVFDFAFPNVLPDHAGNALAAKPHGQHEHLHHQWEVGMQVQSEPVADLFSDSRQAHKQWATSVAYIFQQEVE